ncbi:MAG: hypothetical protein GY854_30900 [Deltaproteobacteria bacterium]|nr:hypothetical protein [Deltaproteobacteria bacterium]
MLFVIDIETRRVEIAGIVQQPHGDWMKQIARNLTDPVEGFLIGTEYLIHDCDSLFSRGFKTILNDSIFGTGWSGKYSRRMKLHRHTTSRQAAIPLCIREL